MSINETWQQLPLGDAMTFQRGFDITKKEQRDGPYQVISSSGPKSTHTKFKVKGPGLVIGRKGTLGSVFYTEDNFWPHDTTLWVKDFHGNDPKFGYYFLHTMGFQALDVGAANPSLNRNHIHTIPVSYPDLPTQRRIAGILSAYDDLIENNLRRIRILEEMAQSLYREWFVHFRIPSEVLHKAGLPPEITLVDSPLGPIPDGWETASIDEVCDRVTDGSHSSPASVEQGMPMASSKDMHAFGLNLEKARTISTDDYNKLVRNGCRPKANDILITKDGANYLKYIFVVEKDLDVVLLSSIAILTPNPKVNPHFFAAVLNVFENKERLKNYVTGAAIPRIILKDFKRFQFVLPPPEIQEAWAKIGEQSTKLCWDLVSKNQTLRQTRALLLPKLLSSR